MNMVSINTWNGAFIVEFCEGKRLKKVVDELGIISFEIRYVERRI